MKRNATRRGFQTSTRAMQSSSSDPYEILNVPRGTTDEEVLKKAYRVQALKWHPDRNPEKRVEAEARFKKVSEAYETLKDPMKRQSYEYGSASSASARAGGTDRRNDNSNNNINSNNIISSSNSTRTEEAMILREKMRIEFLETCLGPRVRLS